MARYCGRGSQSRRGRQRSLIGRAHADVMAAPATASGFFWSKSHEVASAPQADLFDRAGRSGARWVDSSSKPGLFLHERGIDQSVDWRVG